MRSGSHVTLIVSLLIAGIALVVLSTLLLTSDGHEEPLRPQRDLPTRETNSPAKAVHAEPGPSNLHPLGAKPPAPVIPLPTMATPNPDNQSELFQTSVFDRIPDERFEGMDTIQQAAFATLEEKFNAYYREWLASGNTNHEEWNEKLREFHQEMLLNFGPEQMDKLLQTGPSPPAASPTP